jgi:hypothetical protein
MMEVVGVCLPPTRLSMFGYRRGPVRLCALFDHHLVYHTVGVDFREETVRVGPVTEPITLTKRTWRRDLHLYTVVEESKFDRIDSRHPVMHQLSQTKRL